MLTNPSKEFLTAHWDRLWGGLKQSLPLVYDGLEQRIVRLIEKDILVPWVLVRGDEVIGCALTTAVFQAVDARTSLLIYAAYVPDTSTAVEFMRAYNVLAEYAKKIGADGLSFYTTNKKLVSWAQRLGASIEHYVTIPVKEGDYAENKSN